MINTTCCEFTDVFEVAIGIIKGASSDMINNSQKDIPNDMKEIFRTIWVNGAEHFSFLLLDKLWKEDRLCDGCEKIYDKLKGNVSRAYPQMVIKTDE